MTYRVLERLARGGMGVVDLAVDDQGTRFALKRLALVGTADEMQRARVRFERELAVLKTLDHPGIVPLVDVVEDSGELVLVMPFLSGGNLATKVSEGGPLTTDAVRAIADRLLPALASAHRRGIVHRDIKPANVLFDDVGLAYLADFGVAVTRDATPGLTQTGIVLGTPGFLAPEQARGESVTPASDIASLGATLAFAATGASPYGEGEAHAVLLRTARAKAELPKDLDPDLRNLIRPMLDAKPERRPTAAASRGGAEGTTAIPALLRRQPRWVWAAAAGVAVVVLVALVVRTGNGSNADDPTAATTTNAEQSTTTAPLAPVSTAPPCLPKPYQPCGVPPAQFTDGDGCIDDHDDYDGFSINGCEAAPDGVDGRELRTSLSANIVPRGDIDRYPVVIDDRVTIFCGGAVTITLTAPEGITLSLALFDPSGDPVNNGEAVATKAVPGVVTIREGCLTDDGGSYTATVTAVGSDRTDSPYRIERSGNF